MYKICCSIVLIGCFTVVNADHNSGHIYTDFGDQLVYDSSGECLHTLTYDNDSDAVDECENDHPNDAFMPNGDHMENINQYQRTK